MIIVDRKYQIAILKKSNIIAKKLIESAEVFMNEFLPVVFLIHALIFLILYIRKRKAEFLLYTLGFTLLSLSYALKGISINGMVSSLSNIIRIIGIPLTLSATTISVRKKIIATKI